MNVSYCFLKATTYFKPVKPIYEALAIQQKKILALVLAIFSYVAIYYTVKHLIGKEKKYQVKKVKDGIQDQRLPIKAADPCLHKLDLQNLNLSDSEWEDIFKAYPNMRELNLKGSNIADAGLDKLPSGLTSLNLTW